MIVVVHIWISLTFKLMIVPAQSKVPGITLIRFHMPFLLPMETMLLHWTTHPITHNLLNQIIMILTLYIRSWVTTLAVSWQEEDTASGSMMEKYFKTILYCSVCSINTKVYYCHGTVGLVLELRNSFIEHNRLSSLCSVDWCVWLPYLHYFTCWTCFCACVLPALLIPKSSNTSVWSTWNFYPFFLLFSVSIHAVTNL